MQLEHFAVDARRLTEGRSYLSVAWRQVSLAARQPGDRNDIHKELLLGRHVQKQIFMMLLHRMIPNIQDDARSKCPFTIH